MATDLLTPVVPYHRRSVLEDFRYFFKPETVAVFGATDTQGSVGQRLMANLIGSPFGGVIYPISRTRSSAHGVRAFSSLSQVPGPVDLALVATPASTVPDLVEQCSATGVKAMVIYSAGFSEVGPSGATLEQRIVATLSKCSMRLLGPNSIGFVAPHYGINATFAPRMARPGNVGYISQSGSLLAALTDGSPSTVPGCSVFISIGSRIDVDWAECMTYLGNDPRTDSIALYVESIRDVPSFLSAARAVTRNKPIVMLRPRRVRGVARPHMGMSGEWDEQLCRSGILKVDTLADLFHMSEVLAKRSPPEGGRLTIVSNAAGPAVLAVDALLEDYGELAHLTPETQGTLERILPARCSLTNPIDVGDDSPPHRLGEAVGAALKDANTDGVLVILAPQASTDPARAAAYIAEQAAESHKPVLATWLWGAATPESLNVLGKAGVCTFGCPESAVKTFGNLWRHGLNLRILD